MTRPQFEFPPLSFTTVDLALALNREQKWAGALLARMYLAGIVRRTREGKFAFSFWNKRQGSGKGEPK